MYKNAQKLLLIPIVMIIAAPLPSCAQYMGQKSRNSTKIVAKIKPQRPYSRNHNSGGMLKALRKTFGYTQSTTEPDYAKKEKAEQIKKGSKKTVEPVEDKYSKTHINKPVSKDEHIKVSVNKPASKTKPVKPYSRNEVIPQKAANKSSIYKHTPRKPLKPYDNGHKRTETKNKGFWENLLGF